MNDFASTFRAHICKLATAAGLVVAVIVGSPGARAAPAQENDESKLDDLKSQVHFAWQKQEFSKLDEWAKEYGTKTLRSPSGFTYLSSFYAGFTQAFSGPHAESAVKMWEATREAWTQAAPRSATPHIATAEILLTRAGQARGTGFADTVFKENWEKFNTLLMEANDYLRAHREVAEHDPHFWVVMAKTEFLLDGDHGNLLATLRQGLAKHPRYYTPYYIGAYYLLPQWGGSPEAYYAWLDEALRNTTATDGTGILARLYLYTQGGPLKYAEIDKKGPLWEPMRQAMQDELRAFPHWQNVQKFASLACQARDAEEVSRQLAQLSSLLNGSFPPGIPPEEYCNWQPAARSPVIRPGPRDLPQRPRQISQ